MKTATILAGAALVCATASSAPAAEVPASAEDVRPLLVGSAVPEVELPATDGGVVDLAAAARAKPTILIFYRGGW
ncbi:MAG: hypothetical protein OXG83_03725 [Acidobacteria bacterium]|nr:hypothetical protein [Acidobacteriota bacterium]